MNAVEFLAEFRKRGGAVWLVDADALTADAPPEVLTDSVSRFIETRKKEIIAALIAEDTTREAVYAALTPARGSRPPKWFTVPNVRPLIEDDVSPADVLTALLSLVERGVVETMHVGDRDVYRLRSP